MAYKILSDGAIVDAVVCPIYVRYNKKAKRFLSCKIEDAEGIMSHDGMTCWAFTHKGGFDVSGYGLVYLEEISDTEARLIIDALDSGKEIEAEDDEVVEDVESNSKEDIEFVRKYVVGQMANECKNAIALGIDLINEKDGSIRRYSYTIEDQINLLFLQNNIDKFGDKIPYYADSENYEFYSRSDFEKICNALALNRFRQTDYYHRLKRYIRDLKSLKELSDVYWGMDIPDQYKSDRIDFLSLFDFLM